MMLYNFPLPFLAVILAITIQPVLSDCPKPIIWPIGNCTIPPTTDSPNGVNTYGLFVSMGAQSLCVVPSLVTNNTVLMGTNICADDKSTTLAQCIERRGGLINTIKATSNGFVKIATTLLGPDPIWLNFMPAFGDAGKGTLSLGSSTSLLDFAVAIALEGQNSNTSPLGLGRNSTFLTALTSYGYAAMNAFALYVGSQSAAYPRPGHLSPNSYIEDLTTGPFESFKMRKSAAAGTRDCALQVDVSRLMMRRPGMDDLELLSQGTLMPSCIEPYDHLFRFPSSVLQAVKDSTKWVNDTTLVSKDLYMPEPGLIFNNINTSFEASFVFELAGGLTVEIPSHELVGPVQGINLKGQQAVQTNVTMMNVFGQSAPGGTATLGRAFLSQLYLLVNYRLEKFQLGRIAPGNDALPTFVPLDESFCTPKPKYTIAKTTIGLIVLGTAVALALAVFVFLRMRRSWKARQERLREAADRRKGVVRNVLIRTETSELSTNQ